MPTESMPPEEEGGGNLKYGLIGLLLLLGVVGIWFAMSGDGTPPPVATVPDTGPAVSHTSLAQPLIEIPDEIEDAGVDADAAEPVVEDRVVIRHVRDDWDCSGSIDAAAAARIIRGYDRQIRSCYERQLKQNHFLQGNMSVMVRVAADGSVAGTRVGGSLRSPPVFACVRGIARTWNFPPTGGGCAVVSVPFNFSPRE